MGYALAQAARERGADVYLVSGPTHLSFPAGVHAVQVRSAAEMKAAVLDLFARANIVIAAAAVADYAPVYRADEKIKKESKSILLELSPTEDILALLGREKKEQILVGFAAETGRLIERARSKMSRKNLDLIVANDVSTGVFGTDTATVSILSSTSDPVTLENQPKLTIAHRILDLAGAARSARERQAISG